jgi:hypothetical protein
MGLGRAILVSRFGFRLHPTDERAATTPWVGKPGLGGGFADELRNFSASTACLKSAFNIPVQWLLARLAGLKAEYT